MAYVPPLIGLPLAFVLGKLYLRSNNLGTPYFEESLMIYAASCIVQLATEPAFVLAQQKLQFGIRASSEGLATVLKCFATCGAAIYGSRTGQQLGVLPFAMGELTYGVVRLLSYTVQTWPVASQNNVSLLPQRLIASYVLFFY
jgi:oligosaccharide translocation protein RFT1